MNSKNGISQEKGKCKHCHEGGGMHEANCPYLLGYFKGQIDGCGKPKKFVGLWIHYSYNVTLWLLYAGVLIAGMTGPIYAIQHGLVVTSAGKLAMGLIIICTLIATISVMLALDSVNREGPQERNRYY